MEQGSIEDLRSFMTNWPLEVNSLLISVKFIDEETMDRSRLAIILKDWLTSSDLF